MARVTEIRSPDNPLLVRARKLLAQPDAYRKLGCAWIEGDHLCEAWLQRRGGRDVHALIGQTAWSTAGARALADRAEAVAVLPDALMSALSPLESPTALACIVPWSGGGAVEPGLATVVLDRVQDAGNVGTLLRSAAAFGFVQVVALKGTAALWSPKVMRAGMGAHVSLRLVESADEQALAALGVPLLATSSHSESSLFTAPLPWPCAWVFGHEGQGVSGTLLQRCDRSVRIPQPGGGESLNVAVAGSICLCESARRQFAS